MRNQGHPNFNRSGAGGGCQIHRSIRSVDDISWPCGMKLDAEWRGPDGDGVLIAHSKGSEYTFTCWKVEDMNVQIIIVGGMSILEFEGQLYPKESGSRKRFDVGSIAVNYASVRHLLLGTSHPNHRSGLRKSRRQLRTRC